MGTFIGGEREPVIDFSLRLLGSTDIDRNLLLEKFKALLSPRYWVYTQVAITYTRQYRDGLDFILRMSALNDFFVSTQQITNVEYAAFDRTLISFRLKLLDRLDWWPEYIELFERTREDKPYKLTYVLSKSDPEFGKYYLYQDSHHKYCHFLYKHSHRYELIKQKLDTLRARKSVRHLLHKSPRELTSEEVERRFNYVFLCAEKGLPVFEPG